ncbi:MAG: hypothetical protein DRJ05_17445, partial [Bacteroidetes bacterium]
MKIREIHIQDYKIFKDFNIDFTNNESPLDIVVLAGINGSGKSSLLEFIYKLIATNEIIYKVNNKIVGEIYDLESGRLVPITFRSPLGNNISIHNLTNENEATYIDDTGVLFYQTSESDVNSASEAIIQ